MGHKKTIEMINLYFDGELNKEDEAYLFSLISSDEEGREYFKTLNTLKESYRVSEKKYPQTLEEKILKGISEEKITKSSDRYFFIPKALVYTFSVLFVFISLFVYTKFSIHEEKMKLQVEQVEKQTEMINLLINSLPQAEVKGKEVRKVIVRANLEEIL